MRRDEDEYKIKHKRQFLCSMSDSAPPFPAGVSRRRRRGGGWIYTLSYMCRILLGLIRFGKWNNNWPLSLKIANNHGMRTRPPRNYTMFVFVWSLLGGGCDGRALCKLLSKQGTTGHQYKGTWWEQFKLNIRQQGLPKDWELGTFGLNRSCCGPGGKRVTVSLCQ